VKIRAVASVALAVTLTVGLSACNFFSPQNTLQDYDPSDGVGANVGDLNVRNALLITEDGERATLAVSIINTTGEAQSIEIEYDSSAVDAVAGRSSLDLDVPSQSIVNTSSADSGEQIVLENVDAPAGSWFYVYFQSGTSEGVELAVPVLDTTLAEYDGLAPSPSPTPITIPDPVIVPEPIPTPTLGTEPEAPAGGAVETEGTETEG